VTSPALWLALRELAARRRRVALAGAVIAAIAAAATSTELVARAREEAVAAQIDAIGPAVTIVPRGTSPGMLARYDLTGSLARATEPLVREVLGRDLRALERRLVTHRELAGARRPVVGVDRAAIPELAGEGAAAVGAELARLTGPPSILPVEGGEVRVVRVLPSTGSVEDLALFLPMEAALELARAEGPNELRLFLRAGVSSREVEARLSRAPLDAAVIRSDRGDVADRDTHASLARHRGVAYAVMAAVAALCLLVAAHLDAAERRVELATLVAIGASRSTVFGGLLARSGVVAGSAAALGTFAGAVLAASQAPAGASASGEAWGLSVVTIAAAVGVGILAAAPTALAAVMRDPVRALQDC
jgi:putative ABC transport system permease protein